MKTIYLAINTGGYWGRGATIPQALNNANVEFKSKTLLYMVTKPSGKAFTEAEQKKVYGDQFNHSYPTGSTCIDLGTFELSELKCLTNTRKISEVFMDLLDKEGMTNAG